MRKCLIALLFLASPAFAQTTVNGRVQTGFSSAKPATCNPGDQFNATDNFHIYMCGPANTWTQGGIAGNPASPSGSLQGNNAGNFGSVTGSSITFGTGAILLTAGADTTTPLAIASHSATQSAPIADLNVNSSTAGLGYFNVRGIGTKQTLGFSGAPMQMHIMADAPANANTYGLVISNNRSGYLMNGAPKGILGLACGDGGICNIEYGGLDANTNYSGINYTITNGVTVSSTEINFTGNQSVFSVRNNQSATTHDTQEWLNSTGGTMSAIDQFGNMYWNGSTSGKALIGASATGGQLVYSVAGGTSFPVPQEICTGQIALTTGAILSGARATNTLSCSGLSATTDSISCTFSGDTNAVTGYAPSASGGITLKTWASTNTINVDQVNDTGGSITPGAATVNCKGIR